MRFISFSSPLSNLHKQEMINEIQDIPCIKEIDKGFYNYKNHGFREECHKTDNSELDKTEVNQEVTSFCDKDHNNKIISNFTISDAYLSVVGVLYVEQLSLQLTATQKVFLSILTNIAKNTKDRVLSLDNEEIAKRCSYLFSAGQVRRHLSNLEQKGVIFVYYGNSQREIVITALDSYEAKHQKFVPVLNLKDKDDFYRLSFSESLLLSFLFEKSVFYARADVGYLTDTSITRKTLESKLALSSRTIRNAFNSLKSIGCFSCPIKNAKTDTTVKPIEFSSEITIQYSEKFNVCPSEKTKDILIKRIKEKYESVDDEILHDSEKLKLQLQQNFQQVKKFKAKMHGKKSNKPQVKSGKKRPANLEKKESPTNKELNVLLNVDVINAQQKNPSTVNNSNISVFNIGKDPIGILTVCKDQGKGLQCFAIPEKNSHANLDFKLSLYPHELVSINGKSTRGLNNKMITKLLLQRKLCLVFDSGFSSLQKVYIKRDIQV